MTLPRQTFFFLLVPAALGAFAGCQQPDAPKKTGTYAAARHNHVGSNIPQREDVNSTGSTFDEDQFRNLQNSQSTSGMRRGQ